MSNKWFTGGSGRSDNSAVGILRKTNLYQNQNNINNNTNNLNNNETRGADLLVFGYACKIFRDDEKAIYIDHGKHLIPWMGDKTLKIDRYDVRATLSDLTQYEPPPGGYQTNRLDYLTPAEQRAEQLCEEERYHSLYHNEEEEKMYQEEELKRIHQERSSTYGQVQFNYDSIQTAQNQETNFDDKSEELDEIFKPPENLIIPINIKLPETMKQHAIIERTAKFISTQGPQMEILIKAKQSNNPQFEFLNQNNYLNCYYKFVLQEFKNGTYPISDDTKTNNDDNNDTNMDNTIINDNNLHLIQNTIVTPTIPIPTLKYKPSANCAYTQLISKIKGVPLPPPEEQPPINKNNEQQNMKIDDNKITLPTTLLNYNSYYGQYGGLGTHNEPSTSTTIPIIVPSTISSGIQTKQIDTIKTISKNPSTNDVEVKKISTGLMLAQCYNSDTEDDTENSDNDETTQPILDFPIPPDYLQNIIDKTASYVAKNGKQFENILRTKQDERFLFLNENNEYHNYYMYKVTGVLNPYPTSNDDINKPKIINPVSFSIKSKDESSVTIKQVLPQETSDDETIESKTIIAQTPITTASTSNSIITNAQTTVAQNLINTSVPDYVQIPMPLTENQLIIKGTTFLNNIPIIGNINNSSGTITRSRFDVDNTGSIVQPVKLESTQQKELRRAEEKVKDRLAQIAREKLGLISKEKQLQLERKKKAMAFLNQIKGTNKNQSPENDPTTNIIPDINSDSSEISVHSIPISSIDDKSDIEIDDDVVQHSIQISTQNRSTTTTTIKQHKNNETTNDNHNRSRSRSLSKSRSHKKKKKSKHHSKKKSKKRSHSRSRSPNPDSPNNSTHDRRSRKSSSSHKTKKRRYDD